MRGGGGEPAHSSCLSVYYNLLQCAGAGGKIATLALHSSSLRRILRDSTLDREVMISERAKVATRGADAIRHLSTPGPAVRAGAAERRSGATTKERVFAVDWLQMQIRALTRRRTPLRMGELIETINPIIRGWGNYYCRSQVRKRFHQLDGWIVRRLWSHRARRWRNTGWKEYPTKRLLGEFKLVNLVSLIPSLRISRSHS